MSFFEQAKARAIAEILKEQPDTGIHASWINTKAYQARIITEEAMWNSLNGPKPEHFTTEGAIFVAATEIMKQYKMLGGNLAAPGLAAAPAAAACEAAEE
jgi:hypothetical protein